MSERTANLLLCAWVLTAPLLCLLAAHYVEMWLYAYRVWRADWLLDAIERWLINTTIAYRMWRSNRRFRAGIRYGVKHGMLQRDGRLKKMEQ